MDMKPVMLQEAAENIVREVKRVKEDLEMINSAIKSLEGRWVAPSQGQYDYFCKTIMTSMVEMNDALLSYGLVANQAANIAIEADNTISKAVNNG